MRPFGCSKEKEIHQYGEYRARRLVLQAWEELNRFGVINA